MKRIFCLLAFASVLTAAAPARAEEDFLTQLNKFNEAVNEFNDALEPLVESRSSSYDWETPDYDEERRALEHRRNRFQDNTFGYAEESARSNRAEENLFREKPVPRDEREKDWYAQDRIELRNGMRGRSTSEILKWQMSPSSSRRHSYKLSD